jgi:Protein of unknown function (DUF4235)
MSGTSDGNGQYRPEEQAVREARERLGRDLDQLNVEVRAQMGQTAEKLSWQLLTTVAAVGAAIVVRKVLQAAWTNLRPEQPPENPADPDVDWGEAIAWTAATGLVVGVARMIASRGAAGVWKKATGTRPPGLRT